MNGVRVTKKVRGVSTKGSLTVEAALTLSIFLFVIFSLSYIIKVFYVYNTVQASLSEMSRNLANLSYFYHVSGAKDYTDQIKEMADEAGTQIGEQKKTIIDAFDTFNGFFSTGNSDDLDGYTVNAPTLNDLIDGITVGTNMADVEELIQSIIKKPKEELKLFLHVLTEKLSYEITNSIVCLIAKHSLKGELTQRSDGIQGDPALALGIKNGINGIKFNDSSAFGDEESLEFVVRYSVQPYAFVPEFHLSNRVKIIAWTGGRGKSVKVTHNDTDEAQSQSYWNEYDKNKRYCDRGLIIEQEYLKILRPDRRSTGLEYNCDIKNSAIDAYIYNKDTHSAELYNIFSLNPFLKTYSTRHSAITSQIKKHGKQLYQSDIPEELKMKDIKELRRIVILVVPENSENYVNDTCNAACEDLKKYGVEVWLSKEFGAYNSDDVDVAA